MEDTAPKSLEIDFARLLQAAWRRKALLVAAVAAGIGAGLAWHALAPKRYSATISFVRSQASDEGGALGALGPLSLLGMGGQSSDPPLLKFIDKYLMSREFIAGMAQDSAKGRPLRALLLPDRPDASPEAFYGALSGRIKVTKEAGLITVKVWDGDPELSVFLTNRMFERFQRDFDEARRKSIQENLAFANEMLAKSRRELASASSEMREFLERNRGLETPSLVQARDNLMMKVKLAEERYLMAEKERGLLEIKNERKEQSLAVIEKPYLPTAPGYPKRIVTTAVPLFGAIALFFAAVGILDRRAWIRLAAG